jgi:hypothetical protein
MTAVPDRNTFESAYAGQAPWAIGRPQQAFLDVADPITGSVLDAGCGTGDSALSFASRATGSPPAVSYGVVVVTGPTSSGLSGDTGKQGTEILYAIKNSSRLGCVTVTHPGADRTL